MIFKQHVNQMRTLIIKRKLCGLQIVGNHNRIQTLSIDNTYYKCNDDGFIYLDVPMNQGNTEKMTVDIRLHLEEHYLETCERNLVHNISRNGDLYEVETPTLKSYISTYSRDCGRKWLRYYVEPTVIVVFCKINE